jgi:hypothetical protein
MTKPMPWWEQNENREAERQAEFTEGLEEAQLAFVRVKRPFRALDPRLHAQRADLALVSASPCRTRGPSFAAWLGSPTI